LAVWALARLSTHFLAEPGTAQGLLLSVALYAALPLAIIRLVHGKSITAVLGLRSGSAPLSLGLASAIVLFVLTRPPPDLRLLHNSIAVPVLEELLYRGYVLSVLAGFEFKTLRESIPAILLSSLIFAAGHFAYWGRPELLLQVFALGSILGALFVTSKSVHEPIAAHMAINFGVYYRFL
jgi:membrane protease YdiL (CAAX protease family)